MDQGFSTDIPEKVEKFRFPAFILTFHGRTNALIYIIEFES